MLPDWLSDIAILIILYHVVASNIRDRRERKANTLKQ